MLPRFPSYKLLQVPSASVLLPGRHSVLLSVAGVGKLSPTVGFSCLDTLVQLRSAAGQRLRALCIQMAVNLMRLGRRHVQDRTAAPTTANKSEVRGAAATMSRAPKRHHSAIDLTQTGKVTGAQVFDCSHS